MESNYHWLVTIGLVTSSIIAITANTFLLVVFCRKRGLRTVPNRFVINLLITNLLASILLIPLLLADQGSSEEASLLANFDHNSSIHEIDQLVIEENVITNANHIKIIETNTIDIFDKKINDNFTSNSHYNKQKLLCYFAQSSTSFVCTASIFSILLIGINQYFGVIHSLRYHFYINKCRSTIFIAASWIIALFFAILSSVSYSNNSLWHFCHHHEVPSDAVRIFNTIYAFSYFVVVILGPFVAICIIYICIYTAAHKNSQRMRKSNTTNNFDYLQVSNKFEKPVEPRVRMDTHHLTVNEQRLALPKVHSAPNFSQLARDEDALSDIIVVTQTRTKVTRTCSERSTNKFISTLKHKISNASVFRYREEMRAAKISILVILLVLICYIPYGVTLILNSDYVNIRTSQIFHYLSLILLIFSNIISPFLFAYRNKRVKREIGKIFGVNQISQNYLPTSALDGSRRISNKRHSILIRNHSFEDIHENVINEPFLPQTTINNCVIPEVVITCKPETEKKSILKRVCNTSNWPSYKKCNFITVPDSCISGEARGSFSSASTQISSEE